MHKLTSNIRLLGIIIGICAAVHLGKADNEGEECVGRLPSPAGTLPPGCATAPHPTYPPPAFICTGFCFRLNWIGCHDCVEGSSLCQPPTTGCFRVSETGPCAVDYLTLNCNCDPTWGSVSWTVTPGSKLPVADSCK